MGRAQRGPSAGAPGSATREWWRSTAATPAARRGPGGPAGAPRPPPGRGGRGGAAGAAGPGGGGGGDGPRVAAIDCGMKASIARALVEAGCRLEVLPAAATAQEVLTLAPD